jgi:hypothetical protein
LGQAAVIGRDTPLLSSRDRTHAKGDTGQFIGHPGTGRHTEWLGIDIYTLRDGRISEGWLAEDILGLMSQLDATALPA